MTNELKNCTFFFFFCSALHSSHPLGSTRESRRRVPDTENIAIGTILDVMKNAILLSLPVLTANGLKLLHDKQNQRRGKKREEKFSNRADLMDGVVFLCLTR